LRHFLFERGFFDNWLEDFRLLNFFYRDWEHNWFLLILRLRKLSSWLFSYYVLEGLVIVVLLNVLKLKINEKRRWLLIILH
ncbi:MAG: hypothetical protein ACK56F_25555, partial [bacterium]